MDLGVSVASTKILRPPVEALLRKVTMVGATADDSIGNYAPAARWHALVGFMHDSDERQSCDRCRAARPASPRSRAN